MKTSQPELSEWQALSCIVLVLSVAGVVCVGVTRGPHQDTINTQVAYRELVQFNRAGIAAHRGCILYNLAPNCEPAAEIEFIY